MGSLSLREYAGLDRTILADKYTITLYNYLVLMGADMQGAYELGGKVHIPIFGPNMYTYKLATPADIYKIYLANMGKLSANCGLISLASVASSCLEKNE